jgi:hypothetical protein
MSDFDMYFGGRNLLAYPGARRFFCVLGIILFSSACGYRVKNSVGKLPSGIQSLGIPTFKNLTTQYKIEQLISSAVLKEFSIRTRIPVNSSNAGVDSVLIGEIRSVSSTPVTFGTQTTQTTESQTFGSTVLITIQASVKLIRVKDSATVWQNDSFLYRESYVLNPNVRDFYSEENPAINRLARDFAASLASTILEQTSP